MQRTQQSKARQTDSVQRKSYQRIQRTLKNTASAYDTLISTVIPRDFSIIRSAKLLKLELMWIDGKFDFTVALFLKETKHTSPTPCLLCFLKAAKLDHFLSSPSIVARQETIVHSILFDGDKPKNNPPHNSAQ